MKKKIFLPIFYFIEVLLNQVTVMSKSRNLKHHLMNRLCQDDQLNSDFNLKNLVHHDIGTESELNSSTYERDSFHRHSMRRKSLALAQAVSIDLFNRAVSKFFGMD